MPKILLIEDTENNRVLITRRLTLLGYEVLTAEDAEHGVPLVQSAQPDLVLMDIGLPGMDGWNATLQLKSNPATQHIPVLALTAHAMESDREKARQAGCDEFETKPVDFPRLHGKIQQLLAKRHPTGPTS